MTGIEAAVSSDGYLAVLAGTFLEGETIVLIAGYMAHRGYFPPPEVMLAAGAGAFCDDQLYFWIDGALLEYR
jgi:membrane protein DedA with SNARE-associated domain